jgi:predicted MFS family arabinose efflux permease
MNHNLLKSLNSFSVRQLGVGYSIAQTPSGRLLRRSAAPEDRPALFAAQFALSHACWLIAYPVAGSIGAMFGLAASALLLAVLSVVSIIIAWRVWPVSDPENLTHTHNDLPASHPHLHGAHNGKHEHVYVIDDLHHSWPKNLQTSIGN